MAKLGKKQRSQFHALVKAQILTGLHINELGEALEPLPHIKLAGAAIGITPRPNNRTAYEVAMRILPVGRDVSFISTEGTGAEAFTALQEKLTALRGRPADAG